MVRTRTRTGRLARHFPMHALRLRRAPARRLAFPASSVPCIRQGPAQQDEQAPTCAPGPAPPTRPDFPASAAPAAASPGTRHHDYDDTLRAQVAQDHRSARAAAHTAPAGRRGYLRRHRRMVHLRALLWPPQHRSQHQHQQHHEHRR